MSSVPFDSRLNRIRMLVLHLGLMIGLNAMEYGSAAELTIPKQTAETGARSPKLAELDRLMRSAVKRQRISGASLAITKNGRLVYARGFGYADLERNRPVQPDSLFRIASLSKPITAVAILQLIQRRKLNLDDRVVDIVTVRPRRSADQSNPSGSQRVGEGLDARWKQITIRQLLHHSGGWDRDVSFDPMFRSVKIAEAFGKRPPAEPPDIIRYMRGQKLDFDPGTRYAYSNFGYSLLGRVIEKLSGMGYEQYVQTKVLKPLGIRSMRIGRTLAKGRFHGEVRYYTQHGTTGSAVVGPRLGKPVPQPYGAWYLEAMDSHGGWIGSAIDLVRFASAFDNPNRCKVLSARSIVTMFARPPAPLWTDAKGKPKREYYACGWMVRPRSGKVTTWHTGSLPGTSTLLVRRADGVDFTVLFNVDTTQNGRRTTSVVESPIHRAIDRISTWPRRNLFQHPQKHKTATAP